MQLRAQNLTTMRGGREIFEELSFSVDAGQALLLTGPNGSGKTTLLRTIAGFLRPAEGSITLDGGDEERRVGEQAHYIGHLNAVKARLTVFENLIFWQRFLQAGVHASVQVGARAGLVETALERFAIAALRDIPAGYLSAGQKRRLGLSRLLIAARPLWLLDEPTVSLDAASQDILAAIVNEHVGAGGIAIAATHLPLGLKAPRELRLGERSGERIVS